MKTLGERWKLIGRIKLAQFMELSEEVFQSFVVETENLELFKKLFLHHFIIGLESLNGAVLIRNRLSSSKGVVAWIRRNCDNFEIGYFHPHSTKEYLANYEKLRDLEKERYFSTQEIKRIPAFCGRLRLINSRKRIIHVIIKEVVKRQEAFLRSGNYSKINRLTQSEVANAIGIDVSLISRGLKDKLIKIPSGKEILFSHLFRRGK